MMKIPVFSFFTMLLSATLGHSSAAFALDITLSQPKHCPAINDFKIHAMISETDKTWVSSNIYHAVSSYFAHFSGLPETYNFDRAFQNFLKKTASTHLRWDYDLEALKLFASLQNGHTRFLDGNLICTTGFGLPFRGRYSPDIGWIVTNSSIPTLANGAILKKINNENFTQWAQQQKQYIAASSERARNSTLFLPTYLYLWPERFTLKLDTGQKITIDQQKKYHQSNKKSAYKAQKFSAKNIGSNIYLLNLPTFSDPSVEKNARYFLEQHKNAKAILFNVTGNLGGTTPVTVMEALQTKSYQDMIVDTPLTQADNEARILLGVGGYTNMTLRSGGSLEPPDHPLYFGKIYVVTDRYCASACEDFLANIKLSKRGLLLGENSAGYFGEVYLKRLPEQYYNIEIGTKRYFLPDGTPLEGVGITPDIALKPGQKDSNTLLNQAIAYVKQDLSKKHPTS